MKKKNVFLSFLSKMDNLVTSSSVFQQESNEVLLDFPKWREPKILTNWARGSFRRSIRKMGCSLEGGPDRHKIVELNQKFTFITPVYEDEIFVYGQNFCEITSKLRKRSKKAGFFPAKVDKKK